MRHVVFGVLVLLSCSPLPSNEDGGVELPDASVDEFDAGIFDAGVAAEDAGNTCANLTETSCSNSTDDDCDGLIDCADPDCAAQICRPSAGGCDVAEVCGATSCPSDQYSNTCACPKNGPIAGYSEHDGLRSISADNFVLRDTNTWTTYANTFDALGLPKVGLDVLPLNRTATSMGNKPWAGFGGGFFWDSGDLAVDYWIPQGLAGGTAGTRSFIAVSWHYENIGDPNPPTDGTDKGSRISFAEVSSLSAGVTYRHVLFVEPDGTRGIKPVNIHVGGLAWSGSLLYVADTSRGLRVFDLSRISRVSTANNCNTIAGKSGNDVCAYGYEYVLPQVGGYYFPSGLSASCKPLFSFVALDRSTTPHTLISGEYDNDATGIYSRVLRWPLTSTGGFMKATGAWYAGSRNVQGAIASGSKFFMNATRYSGALITGSVGSPSRVLKASDDDWGWMPEGMYISAAGNLWVSTEGHANLARSVFYARIADVP